MSLFEGYLHVKLSADARSGLTGNWRVWSRRWVIVRPDAVAEIDAIAPVAVIDIYRDERQAQKLSPAAGDSTRPSHKPPAGVLRRVASSRKSLLFRCKSRTQPHAFTICQSGGALIHLAGASETDAQSWMDNFRNILWPQDDIVSIERTMGCGFPVSIIDNEFSYRAGLLGCYGYLGISSRKVVLSHPHTGHVIQEWYLKTVSFKKVPQPKTVDDDKLLEMICDKETATGYGILIFYCSDGVSDIIERVQKVRGNMFRIQRSATNPNMTACSYQEELIEQFSYSESPLFPAPSLPPLSPSSMSMQSSSSSGDDLSDLTQYYKVPRPMSLSVAMSAPKTLQIHPTHRPLSSNSSASGHSAAIAISPASPASATMSSLASRPVDLSCSFPRTHRPHFLSGGAPSPLATTPSSSGRNSKVGASGASGWRGTTLDIPETMLDSSISSSALMRMSINSSGGRARGESESSAAESIHSAHWAPFPEFLTLGSGSPPANMTSSPSQFQTSGGLEDIYEEIHPERQGLGAGNHPTYFMDEQEEVPPPLPPKRKNLTLKRTVLEQLKEHEEDEASAASAVALKRSNSITKLMAPTSTASSSDASSPVELKTRPWSSCPNTPYLTGNGPQGPKIPPRRKFSVGANSDVNSAAIAADPTRLLTLAIPAITILSN